MTQTEQDTRGALLFAFALMAVAAAVRALITNFGIQGFPEMPLALLDLIGPLFGLIRFLQLR